MPWYKADLHIHSCLSPCGDLSMGPINITESAVKKGLNLIALTDHNSALNTPAVCKLCKKHNIAFIPGLEICTVEEVHVLALFPTLDTAKEMDALCRQKLIKIPNNPDKTGDQIQVNHKEEIVAEYPYYLLSSTTLELSQVVKEAHKLGGLVIPSHIDRATFSCYSQLGFLPDEDFDAVEIYNSTDAIDTRGKTIIKNSDAHFPEDIAQRHFLFKAEKADFCGLKQALKNNTIKPYPPITK